MKVNYALAFGAGVAAGAAFTVLEWLARVAQLTSVNMSMVLGAMFTQDISTGTWILGFLVHLVVSGLIAIVYALVFKAWGPANWWHGVVVAIPHTLLAGLFTVMMPVIHPAMPEMLPAPGFLAINFGVGTMILVILLHLVYGAIVGAIYHAKPVSAGARPAHA